MYEEIKQGGYVKFWKPKPLATAGVFDKSHAIDFLHPKEKWKVDLLPSSSLMQNKSQ